MFDSKLTAIRWIQLQCNREEARERPGALQNRTVGGQPPCPRRLAVKSDFKTSLYEMIMIFCLLSVKHTWGNVDVDEQTWLGCRAFVASTSSSLLNWMAFVLFLNIWPYFCQNFVKRGVLFLLFESHSEPLRSIFSDSKDYLPAKKRRLYIQLVEAALYTGHHTSWRS